MSKWWREEHYILHALFIIPILLLGAEQGHFLVYNPIPFPSPVTWRDILWLYCFKNILYASRSDLNSCLESYHGGVLVQHRLRLTIWRFNSCFNQLNFAYDRLLSAALPNQVKWNYFWKLRRSEFLRHLLFSAWTYFREKETCKSLVEPAAECARLDGRFQACFDPIKSDLN